MNPNTSENTIHIQAKSQTFTVLTKTINKFRDSLLSKVVNGGDCDFMTHDGINKFSADMDPDSLRFIINYMRGYPYANIEEPLLSKVFFDANRLGISSLLADIKMQIAESVSKDDIVQPQPQAQPQSGPILRPINVNNLAKNNVAPQQPQEPFYTQQEYAQQQHIQQHVQQQKQYHAPHQQKTHAYHNAQNTQTSNNPENYRNLQNAHYNNQLNRAFTDVQWHDQHDPYDDYAHDQFGIHHHCATHSYTH